MTDFSAIPSGDVDPDSPLTTGLVTKLRDNHLAQAENAPGSPDINGLDPLLEVTVGAQTNVDVKDIITAAHDIYIFEWLSWVGDTDSSNFVRARVSTDNGSTFISTSTYKFGASLTTQYTIDGQSGLGSAAGEGSSFQMLLFDPLNSAMRTRITLKGCQTKSNGDQIGFNFAHEHTGLIAVNAIRFFNALGNFESGTLRVYGRRT